jgi:colanic acid biosynthesis glycosyl transferase WcaI
MKVRLWGINYAPEFIGIGLYNTELAEFLSGQGHDVTMVSTFSYYPAWKKRDEDRGRWSAHETINGVNVFRCWHYVPSRVSARRRIAHELSFVLTSLVRQFFLPCPDVILVVSPPLLLGWAAWLLTRFKKAPFVFHVQDLQPDAAVKLGMLKPAWLAKPVYYLEKFAYRKAAWVSVISSVMADAIRAKGIPGNRVKYFPNWVTLQGPLPTRADSKVRLGLPADAQVISYAGNLGEKQGVPLLAEVARQLQEQPNLVFVVAGEGPGRAALEAIKLRYGLGRMILRDLLSTEEHICLLRASDLCILPQRAGSGASFFPSKLLNILACARPIVTNAEAESALARSVRDGEFGFIVEETDPASFAHSIIRLLERPADLEQMGEAARQYAARFDKNTVLEAFERLLREGQQDI